MDNSQHEIYEYARDRIKQKKVLSLHLILLVTGSLFLFVANKWLSFYPETNWWIWVVTIWIFIFLFHTIKVFITDSFMNKHWERAQIDKLMLKQTKKIEQLKNDLENSKSSQV
jgi:amino acid permease